MSESTSASLLRPDRDVGIVGYGAYIPRYRLPATEVSRIWTGGVGGVPVKEKAVAGLDEDVVTMSVEAAEMAGETPIAELLRAAANKQGAE